MSEKRGGANVGDILIGTFVILFGLCITFAGGACTMMWGSMMFHRPGNPYAPGLFGILMLLVSLAAVAFGIFILYHGLRIARGRYRNG